MHSRWNTVNILRFMYKYGWLNCGFTENRSKLSDCSRLGFLSIVFHCNITASIHYTCSFFSATFNTYRVVVLSYIRIYTHTHTYKSQIYLRSSYFRKETLICIPYLMSPFDLRWINFGNRCCVKHNVSFRATRAIPYCCRYVATGFELSYQHFFKLLAKKLDSILMYFKNDQK